MSESRPRWRGALIPTTVLALAGTLALLRPSVEPWRKRDHPPPGPGQLSVRFLGTTSLLIQDGSTTILSDGFFSRPGVLRSLLLPVAPDCARIQDALNRLEVQKIDAVFTGHSHLDHALDAPTVAERTGATLIGSKSTKYIWLGHEDGSCGFSPGRRVPFREVRAHRDTVSVGRFLLTFLESKHGPKEKFRGPVKAPVRPPAMGFRWRTGEVWSVLVEHGDGKLLIHGSGSFKTDALKGVSADVVYLGIARITQQPSARLDAYWNDVVRDTGAKRVYLIHWDDFSRGLDEPLRPLPYVLGSVTSAIRQICKLAARDNVEVILPELWEPVDPFAGPHVSPRCPTGAR